MRHSLTAGSDALRGGEERFSLGIGTKQCKPQQPVTLTAAIHHCDCDIPFRGWYKVAVSGQGSAAASVIEHMCKHTNRKASHQSIVVAV